MVYQIRKYSKHLLAFVKPESFTASPLQSGHDHINIVVTQAQHGAVRIDAHIRWQELTYLVKLSFGEGFLLLEQIIQGMKSTQLFYLN